MVNESSLSYIAEGCDCKLLTARREKPRIRPPFRFGEL